VSTTAETRGSKGDSSHQSRRRGRSFCFAVASIDGRYEGEKGADARSITGVWTQGKVSYSLNLVRATAEAEWAIPELAANMAPDADPAYAVVTI
jgi:hypothetical protein